MDFELLSNLFLRQFWQVSAVIAAVALAAPLIGQRRPHFAYLLWLLVFLKCLTPPIMSSPTSLFSWLQAGDPPTTVSNEAWQDITNDGGVQFEARPAAPSTSSALVDIADTQAATTDPLAGISWTTLMFSVWVAGAISYGAYLAIQWIRLHFLVNRSTVIDNSVAEAYFATTELLGIARAPKLVIVDQPLGPAVVGCLYPTIVLPSELAQKANSVDLQVIFTHELNHIRRGDVGVAWLQAVASCLWWFHPLVWYANLQIVRWREAVCDEEVIAELSISPRTYADALLCVLESRVRPFPAMQVGMAAGESTQQRLIRLMKHKNPCRRTPLWCWAAAIGLGLSIMPGGAFSEPQNADFTVVPVEDNAQEDGVNAAQTVNGVIGIELVGSDGSLPSQEPVLREALSVRITPLGKPANEISDLHVAYVKDGKTLSLRQAKRTDDGSFLTPTTRFIFDRSNPGIQNVIVMARTEAGDVAWTAYQLMGFDGLRLCKVDDWDSFSYFVSDDSKAKAKKKKPLSAEISFHEHVNLSGCVRDADGNPVGGATVSTTHLVALPPDEAQNDKALQAASNRRGRVTQLPKPMRLTTKTDANGRWTLGKISKEIAVDVSVTAANEMTISSTLRPGDQSWDLSIPASRETTIRVVDTESEQPVSNVNVRASLSLAPKGVASAVGRSDEQGTVRLAVPLGELGISMQPVDIFTASNYPTTRAVTVGANTDSMKLEMDGATHVEFQILKTDGLPLSYLSVVPTRDSQLEYRVDRSKAVQGITHLTCKSGKAAKFIIPGLAHRGYEIANPIDQPMDLPPAAKLTYSFRVRKLREYRLPVNDDETHLFSAAHQAATKRLRSLGAYVQTNGIPGDAQSHCTVQITQLWKGTPEDLRAIHDLQYLTNFMSFKFPVPKEFSTQSKLPPALSDDALKALGKAKKLRSIYLVRDSFTDTGLAQLAGCTELQDLQLENTTLRGSGFHALSDLGLQSIIARGGNVGTEEVDLTKMKKMIRVILENTAGLPVLPPKVGSSVLHADIKPANRATLDRLQQYENLQYVLLGGPTLTDELLKHPVFHRTMLVHIAKADNVSNQGLVFLNSPNSELRTLVLSGKQFTDDAVPHLIKLSRLRDLMLQGTSITKDGINKIEESLPKLNLQVTEPPS